MTPDRYPIPGWGVPHTGVPQPRTGVSPGRDLGPVIRVTHCKGHGTSESIMDGDEVYTFTGGDMGPVKVLWGGDEVPPGKDMGPVEVLWDGDGVTPPSRCGQTHTPGKTISCRRTTYVGANNVNFHEILLRRYATISCCKTVFAALQLHFPSHNNVI